MTPREKAAQLVVNNQLKVKSLDYKEAVLVSLVIVSEIIESRKDDSRFNDLLWINNTHYTPHPMYLNYWLQVKQELEKLGKKQTLK